MKNVIRLLWPGVAALVVVLCVFAFTQRAQAGTVATTVYGNYVPLYVPKTGAVFSEGAPGQPILSLKYVKQSDQVDFKVCAQLVGDGIWALTYPGVGDPIPFSYPTYTWTCIDTPTGLGGGTIGQNLQLWLTQGTGQTAHIMEPNIFVSTQAVQRQAK